MSAAVEFNFSPAQWAFWQATERYVDFEGAVRAGKTTPALLKVIHSCQNFPGIYWLIGRWTQDATDAQLKPRFRELCPAPDILGWNAQEQYFELKTVDPKVSSRVYVRGLKSSEDAARYSKFAGLTLAGIYVDQPEELPRDFYLALQARLSQPGYPQQMLLTPNPPDEGHWLASEFPTDRDLPDHRYIRTSVYDNRAALGEQYIAALEAAYPPGTVLRRRFIDGIRGLSVVGEPVYAGYFQRRLHEADALALNPEAPLLESWDFGHHHPCVVWAQFLPMGALHVLGGVMGEAMFLEDFTPMVLQLRASWFPRALSVQTTGDPAGDSANSQGTNRSAADVLRSSGIRLSVLPGANHPDKRNTALQTVSGYMRRLTASGPAFQIHPRFQIVGRGYQRTSPVLVDALEAGYVWDERSTASSTSPSTRRPKKDGFYDHSMNCLEYLVLQYGPKIPETMPAPAVEAPPKYTNLRSINQQWMS